MSTTILLTLNFRPLMFIIRLPVVRGLTLARRFTHDSSTRSLVSVLLTISRFCALLTGMALDTVIDKGRTEVAYGTSLYKRGAIAAVSEVSRRCLARLAISNGERGEFPGRVHPPGKARVGVCTAPQVVTVVGHCFRW